MQVLTILLGVLVMVIVALVNTIVVMWAERKFLGHIQLRMGPVRTGRFGLLQPIADAFKMLGKEEITPSGVERFVFRLAPLITFTPALLIYAAMPWVESFAGASMDVGVFMLFAVAALAPVGVLLAGWASYNKYSLIGGLRAGAQQISYEVPMILSVLGIVMLAGSMRLSDIVDAQAGAWYIVVQPFAFLLFFIGMLAELNRVPFDIPEAESELVGGFNTEYSSMRFALFFVAEYANVFTWSLIATLLFLGGWSGPVLPDLAWILIKTHLVALVIIWVRGTFPRARVDQLMDIGWKLLLPAALVNVLVTAVGVVTNAFVLVVLELVALAGFIAITSRLGARTGDDVRSRASERIAAWTTGADLPQPVSASAATSPALIDTTVTSEGTVTP